MISVRNVSFRWEMGAFVAATVVLATAAWLVDGARSALWVACMGVVACVLFAVFSKMRFQQIGRLASEVDEVLHEGRRIDFSDYREGDLAVLRNELSKMVATLHNTSTRLESEKAALADALADVSHQIRTPLTAMGLMIFAIENSADDAERNRALRELETMVDRVGWLVSTLLKLAKMDAGAFRVQSTRVNAADMARSALAPLAATLDLHDVTCTVEADGEASFMGDGAWSAEALENVLKNCMEHTPAGGSIDVRITEDAVACRIRVTDTGSGIAEQDLPHIFERFYRGETHNSQGFGIGLALAQSLVVAQGGTLRASRAPQGGARFDMVFPKMTV